MTNKESISLSVLGEFRQVASWFSDRRIALFLFFFAFALRFAFRSAGLFHMDSVGYANLGELTFKTLSMHYAHFPGHPGIVLINAAFYGLLQLFGFDSEFTTIFVSVFFGALAAPLIYLICIRLGLLRTYALYAGILMVFFPLQWSLSEYMPTDVESLFFLLAAFYFALKTDRESLSLYLSSFLFMFSITIKLENIFLLPFYIGMCLISLRHSYRGNFNNIIAREIIFVLLIQIIGLALLYGPYVPSAKGVIDDPIRIASVQIKTLSWQLKYVFYLMLTTFSLCGIVFIILGIAGIFGIRKNRKNSAEHTPYSRSVAFTLLSLSISSILFSASIPLRDYDRYILTGFSLLIIFMAYGLRLLGEVDKSIPAVGMIVLVVYMVYITLPIVSDRHNWAGQKEFAKNLKDLAGEDAVIVALNEGSLINYYTNLTVIQPDLNIVENLLKHNRSVYIVASTIAYPQGYKFVLQGKKRLDFIRVSGFLNEDWHGKVLNRNVFFENVYQIKYRGD